MRTAADVALRASLCLATLCSAWSVTGAALADDDAPDLPLRVRPTIGLQETFTDNALLTPTNRSADLITRAMFAVDADLNAGRASGTLRGEVDYDAYARHNDMNGASLSANATGAYVIVPDALRLEASGVVTNGYTSTFNAPASDRSGTPDRVQVATYDVGPRLDAHLHGVELAAAARFSQIFYSAAAGSAVQTVPADDDIVQLVGRARSGETRSGLQTLTAGEYQKDSHGFRQATGVQSVFAKLRPGVRLILRGGYEHIFQPGVTKVDSAIWSAGVELSPNARSLVTLEGGHRYGRASWAAAANVRVTDRTSLKAAYTERLQPDQISVADSFATVVDQTAELPPPLAPRAFRFAENLYDQTSYAKSASLHALYSGAVNLFDLGANWSNREFFPDHTHDRNWSASASYSRYLRPNLSGTVDAIYSRTLASPLYGAARTYAAAARLVWRINPSTDFNAAYETSHSRQQSALRLKQQEQAVLFSIRKAF